jgi:type IV secretion system protein TrbC
MIATKALSKLQKTAAALSLAVVLTPLNAFAGGSGMPWEAPLDQLLASLSGPVARVVGVAAIIVTGLGIAFGEGGGGMRKILWIVFGLTIAFSATSFFLSFLGGGSGAEF